MRNNLIFGKLGIAKIKCNSLDENLEECVVPYDKERCFHTVGVVG